MGEGGIRRGEDDDEDCVPQGIRGSVIKEKEKIGNKHMHIHAN